MEKYFIDIPIYRCFVERHTEEMDNNMQRYIQLFKSVCSYETMENKLYAPMANHFDRKKWYPWRYNEFIGCLRLYINLFHLNNIYTMICQELEFQKNRQQITRHYSDTELFESIGQFVDWRKMMGFKNTDQSFPFSFSL